MLCSSWDSNKNSDQKKHKIRGILYSPPAIQKAVSWTKRVNKDKPLLGAAGKPPLCLRRLPTCLYTAMMRLWMWKVSQRMMWMMAHLHQRYCWTERTGPCVMTTSIRKKRWAVVVGDSLVRGTAGPLCWTDPPLRESCCLPATLVKDITRKVLRLVQPSDYYPLLFFHVGNDEAATLSKGNQKRCHGL